MWPFLDMKSSLLNGVLMWLAVTASICAGSQLDEDSGKSPSRGPTNAVVLIIRHAEKPDDGSGLSATGEARAKAYATYFQNYELEAKKLKLDHLFAAADSRESRRPRLTLEPLGKALNLRIDCRFKNKQFPGLTREIQNLPPGGNILICWHHGEIPQLLRGLGADPEKLLPHARWPDDEYDWVIELRYDGSGQLMASKRVSEHLSQTRAGQNVRTAQ